MRLTIWSYPCPQNSLWPISKHLPCQLLQRGKQKGKNLVLVLFACGFNNHQSKTPQVGRKCPAATHHCPWKAQPSTASLRAPQVNTQGVFKMYIFQSLTPWCGCLQSPACTLTCHYMGYGTPANWQTGRHCSLWGIYFTTALNPGWDLIFWAQHSRQSQFLLISTHFPSWVFPTSWTHPACWTMVQIL